MNLLKQPRRIYREIKASSTPNLGDSSTPKFAEHWEHCEAVRTALRGCGFPYFDIPSRPQVARPPFSRAA